MLSRGADAMKISDALASHPYGTIMALEVTPNAKHERFPDGYNPWRRTIGCSVSTPPLEGRANRAVIALVAEALGVKKGEVELVAGSTSSLKRILVRGMTMDEVESIILARHG